VCGQITDNTGKLDCIGTAHPRGWQRASANQCSYLADDWACRFGPAPGGAEPIAAVVWPETHVPSHASGKKRLSLISRTCPPSVDMKQERFTVTACRTLEVHDDLTSCIFS